MRHCGRAESTLTPLCKEEGRRVVKTNALGALAVVGGALVAVSLLVLMLVVIFPTGPAHGASFPPDSTFTDSPFASGLTNPTDMEFAPDGRLFVAEQAGRVRIAKPDGTLTTFLDISTKVDSSGERGLQALTFDPDFSTNHYLYLHYTRKATSTAPPHNRVVRVTAKGDKAVSGSEKLVFRLGNQTSDHHMGGAIDFGKDGKLYISTGDNEVPNKAQQLTNLFGKMLRINKSGTIPTKNPFYPTTSGKNRAIWALGLRNPFKFAVRPGTGTIFINDVGQDAWEEIDEALPGANYGWGFPTSPPYYEGFIASPSLSLQNYENPVFFYGHDGDIDTTGCSITGGAFYDPTTATNSFASYQGEYFYTDFCSAWIRVFDPSNGTDSAFASGIVKPVDLEVGDDGGLYYLYRGSSTVPAGVRQIR
jgi:glucose/arabinose dehydrogenase